MRILALAGSLQADSANRRMLVVAQERVPHAGIELFDGLGALPYFNPDLAAATPPSVVAWREALASSDAVLIAAPEYGHSLPGVLKNAIDWVIGSGELERKIVAVTASVPHPDRGRGGLRALCDTLAAVSATIVGGEPIARGPDFEARVVELVTALVAAVERRPDPAAVPATARFVPEHTVRLAAHRRLLAERHELTRLLPAARVVHVGSTSRPGALTSGGLDLALSVAPSELAAADAVLAERYARDTASFRSQGISRFDAPGDPSLAVALVVRGAERDVLAAERDTLLADVELARRYDDEKRAAEGVDLERWRARKRAFFAALTTSPSFAAAAPLAAHRRALEGMYLGAPVNRIYRPDIAVAPGVAVVTAEARPELHHAAASLHGSVFFKMLDDAAFFAVASLVPDVFVVTASFHVSLLRAIGTGAMRSVGRVVRAGSTLTVAEATLYDPDGREAARGTGDFARARGALASVPGYRLLVQSGAG